jgi:hypothetical protein
MQLENAVTNKKETKHTTYIKMGFRIRHKGLRGTPKDQPSILHSIGSRVTTYPSNLTPIPDQTGLEWARYGEWKEVDRDTVVSGRDTKRKYGRTCKTRQVPTYHVPNPIVSRSISKGSTANTDQCNLIPIPNSNWTSVKQQIPSV